MKMRLVFTSDLRTWSKEKKNILLGIWCLPYNQIKDTSSFQYDFAPIFNPTQKQKNADLEYLRCIEKKLLSDIGLKLNEILRINHSSMYWEMLIGHWVIRYVRVLFNRFHTLNMALQKHDEIDEVPFLVSPQNLVAQSELQFIHHTSEPLWNQVLLQRIVELKFSNLKKEKYSIEKENGVFSNDKGSDNFSFKKFLRKFLAKYSWLLSFPNDAFFHNTYLPKKQEILLSLKFWQWPQFWVTPTLDHFKLNHNLRNQLKLNLNQCDELETLARQMLNEYLPIVFLEGHKEILSQTKSLPWPKRPKFIFTSNSFDTDTLFKMWTAEKREEGVIYITGQHGNNYGTHFWAGTKEWPERHSADAFITWGWKDSSLNSVPAFNYKINLSNVGKYNKNGGILLIENSLPQMNIPWDVYADFEIFQEDQFKFSESLSEELQNKLLVRLHSSYKILPWHEDKRWNDRFPMIKLDLGSSPIFSLISNSRLIVHSYDSTGILETLSLNIPTVCFWHGGFDHLLDDAKKDYELLKEASIYFDSPVECANFIKKNWDNLDTWWNSEKVQNTRAIFCHKYSRVEKFSMYKLKNILESIYLK